MKQLKETVSLNQLLDLMAATISNRKQGWRVVEPSGYIRNKRDQCPICALHEEIMGEVGGQRLYGDFVAAGKQLGLDGYQCSLEQIVNMADKRTGNIRLKRALGMV